jgi:hypothetical protein
MAPWPIGEPQAKLGDQALSEVLAALRPGDCQSCGTGLGPGKPALAIDDLHVLTRATVHYRACRAPRWNDSLALRMPTSALLTWRTIVLLLLCCDAARLGTRTQRPCAGNQPLTATG